MHEIFPFLNTFARNQNHTVFYYKLTVFLLKIFGIWISNALDILGYVIIHEYIIYLVLKTIEISI